MFFSIKQFCAVSLYIAVAVCILVSTYTLAQEEPADNAASDTNSTALPLSSQLSFNAGVLREDIKRQIRTEIIPLTFGDIALSAFLHPSVQRTNKGLIAFVADGQTNSTRLTLYRALAQEFQEDGYTALVTVLPYPPKAFASFTDAQDAWLEPLTALQQNMQTFNAPIQVIVAHGQVAATLLHLYREQALSAPTALVLDNVFFGDDAINQTIPGLIAQQSLPVLDFHARQHHLMSRQTAQSRVFAGQRRGLPSYRQRELLGMGFHLKQVGFIHKEIKGFLKSMGWI
jgi:hypothetical protein